MMRGNVKRLLLVALVVLLLLVGCTPSAEPTPTVTPDPKTWRTYTDYTFDYSIQYPSIWSTYDSNAGNVTFKLSSDEFVNIKVYDVLPGWSPPEMVEKRIRYMEQNQEESDYSSWTKQEAMWEGSWELSYYFVTKEGKKLHAREVFIPTDIYLYEVSRAALVESEEYSSHSAILDAVVNSFQVITY